MRNPDNTRTDDVDKFLVEEKSMEDRKQALIVDLLKQKESANEAFDEKLAKHGYRASSSGRQKRSHHIDGREFH